MTFDRNEAFSGECCTDCLFLLANGDTPAGMNEEETAGYLARVAQYTAGTEVTLGMFREDHPCRVNFTVTWAPTHYSRQRLTAEYLADDIEDARWQWHCEIPAVMLAAGARIVGYPRRHDLMTRSDLGGECECEQTTFSWSQCDVCGSNLGGAREAVVFWPEPDTQPLALAAPSPDQPR
jgi:hypothetical protein